LRLLRQAIAVEDAGCRDADRSALGAAVVGAPTAGPATADVDTADG
jgi:hypothetical protein